MPGLGGDRPSRNFALSGTSADFSSRSQDVFASLDQIESQHTAHVNEHSAENRQSARSRSLDQEDEVSGRDRPLGRRPRQQGDGDRTDHFKRPYRRPPRRSYVPDFRRNPQNYTEYDLSSVEDHTERNNTAAALDFLNEVRQRRQSGAVASASTAQADYETDAGKSSVWSRSSDYVRRKHTFSKPDSAGASHSQAATTSPSSDSCTEQTGQKASFVDGKLTMPKYVIGQETKTNRKVQPGLSCDALSLDHLNEEDNVKEKDNEDAKEFTGKAEENIEKVQFRKIRRKAGTRKRGDSDKSD